jgi:hypothetical protein
MSNKVFEELSFSLFEEVPEQCSNCEYYKLNYSTRNWCYMFEDKPKEECKQYKKSDK